MTEQERINRVVIPLKRDIEALAAARLILSPEELQRKAEDFWASVQGIHPSIIDEIIDHVRLVHTLRFEPAKEDALRPLEEFYLALCRIANQPPKIMGLDAYEARLRRRQAMESFRGKTRKHH